MIDQFINFVIRPPRAEYNPEEYLWDQNFTLSGRNFIRQDLQLTNSRGHTLRCSHYLPSPFPLHTSSLPCVIYCHGNSGCRADANEAALILLPSNITVFTLDFSGYEVSSNKMEFTWCKDEMQTSRILFYLRVIPTCAEGIPASVFRKTVAPILFLYMGHPNGKVTRASHSTFVAFISSGKDDNIERVSLKEQLIYYYMQRSLEGFPGVTPFEGMASGVAALVRYLPAGSPSIFYCINCLIEKAISLSSEVPTEPGSWNELNDELEPCKKLLDLLLRLLSLVDIQVLPSLMKLLAQVVVQLPEDGQNMVLNDLYAQVADSDDVTRKPALVSWVQSLSYLSSQATIRKAPKEDRDHGKSHSKSWNKGRFAGLNRIFARI